MTSDKQRDAFERWAHSEGYDPRWIKNHYADDPRSVCYENVYGMWGAWQAATAECAREKAMTTDNTELLPCPWCGQPSKPLNPYCL